MIFAGLPKLWFALNTEQVQSSQAPLLLFWQSLLKSALTFLFLAFLLIIIVGSETAETRWVLWGAMAQWNNYKRSAGLSRDNAPTRPPSQKFCKWQEILVDCTNFKCNSASMMPSTNFYLSLWIWPFLHHMSHLWGDLTRLHVDLATWWILSSIVCFTRNLKKSKYLWTWDPLSSPVDTSGLALPNPVNPTNGLQLLCWVQQRLHLQNWFDQDHCSSQNVFFFVLKLSLTNSTCDASTRLRPFAPRLIGIRRTWQNAAWKMVQDFGFLTNLDVFPVLELLQIPLEVALCGGPARKFHMIVNFKVAQNILLSNLLCNEA